ncbi:MAG TPA: hypothetical protein VF267_00515 [Gammaproteobacteria bacterium]
MPASLADFAQSLSLFQTICIAASLSGLGIFLLWKAHDQGKLWLLIVGLPTQRIRSCAQGYAELNGRAVMLAGDEIRSTGGRRCVWFRSLVLDNSSMDEANARADVFEYQGLGLVLDATQYGVRISDHLFGISDDTGLCIVDPEGARIIPSTRQRRMTLNGCTAFEQYILENDVLYILGHFESLDAVGVTHDRSTETAARVRHWKQSRYPELVAEFDRNGDGELDVEEWASVREKAREELASEYRQRAYDKDVHLIRKPGDGKPYVIAASHEDTLKRRLARHAVIALAAALVAAALLALLLLARSAS